MPQIRVNEATSFYRLLFCSTYFSMARYRCASFYLFVCCMSVNPFIHSSINVQRQTWHLSSLLKNCKRYSIHMSRLMTNQHNGLCAQQRFRSAWASAQSELSPCCPHEESLAFLSYPLSAQR